MGVIYLHQFSKAALSKFDRQVPYTKEIVSSGLEAENLEIDMLSLRLLSLAYGCHIHHLRVQISSYADII